MQRYLLAVFSLLLGLSVPAASAADEPLTVMSRNLYLGADVGVALELIPDFPAAAQFMWDQVAATDFSKRASKLAAEVIANDVDVVGLQEATTWFCKKNLWSKKVVVFNFTEEFLQATKAAGREYVLATKDGVRALNVGYSIPAIPYLTMVNDPLRFQPIFGSDRAACGFEIGDAIAIKRELLSNIRAVGNSEYESSYSIIPKIMTIYRGYTWIDLRYGQSTVRVVSTHLESLWDSGKVPLSAIQAKQLIDDLGQSDMPLIVMGDFNSDPRDPRSPQSPNPGGQPESSEACKAQRAQPNLENAITACNAYWLMRAAGFSDVGPDALDGAHFTWGMGALLTGADPLRLKSAQEMGNKWGFTDRLDYIFTKNGAVAANSKLIGNLPPGEGLWPSDHAGVSADIILKPSTIESPALESHQPFPISFWNWVGITIFVSIALLIYRRRRRS